MPDWRVKNTPVWVTQTENKYSIWHTSQLSYLAGSELHLTTYINTFISYSYYVLYKYITYLYIWNTEITS